MPQTSLNAPQPALLVTVALALGAVLAAAVGPMTALGQLAGTLGTSDGELVWIMAIYPATVAVLLVPLGRLGQRIGPYRTLLMGLGLLGLASLASTIVESLRPLLALRAVAGLGAALIVPNAFPTLLISDPETPSTIDGSDPSPSARLHWLTTGPWAAAIAGSWIVVFVVAGVIGGRTDWKWIFVSVFVAAMAALMADLAGNPEVTPTPTSDRVTTDRLAFGYWVNITALAIVVVGAGLAAGTGLRVVTHLQLQLDIDPLAAVASLLPSSIAAVLAATLGPRVVDRIGLAQTLALSAALMALALAWLALTDVSILAIQPPMLVLGAGIGLGAGPAVLASADLPQSTASSRTMTVAAWAGSALGLALIGLNSWSEVFTGAAAVALVTGTAIYVFALRTAATRTLRPGTSAGQERTEAAVA